MARQGQQAVKQTRKLFILIQLSLLTGIALAIFPLPDWIETMRPDWVALILIYWCVALPSRTRFSYAFFYGLLLDIATGTLLGQHALGLIIVSFAILKNHARLRLFPLVQQSILVLLLLIFKQLVFLWIYGITNSEPGSLWIYFLPSITSSILWPWVFIFMDNIQRRFSNN
jgi:rod shape-determining protein MreD